MAYVGKTPAATALTSNDLADGIVSSSKISSDAVTNPKTEFTPGLEVKGDGASADGKIILNSSCSRTKLQFNFTYKRWSKWSSFSY
jgi:hypothetical protein